MCPACSLQPAQSQDRQLDLNGGKNTKTRNHKLCWGNRATAAPSEPDPGQSWTSGFMQQLECCSCPAWCICLTQLEGPSQTLEHRGRAVYISNPLPFFGEPLLATHCYTFQQQLAIKFISINAHHSTTFPLLAAVSPMFQYFKPLSSTLCYLSSAHTAKSLCRVSMWLREEAKQRNTVTKKKGKGKKRTWQEEKLTLEKCQPYTVNLQVGRRNTIKHKERGSLMTDVCKGLTWGWLKNKQL